MKSDYYLKSFPQTRIATIDMFPEAIKKHYISALLEFDVTESRVKLKELRKAGVHISFNAWIIKVIGAVLAKHPEATGYLYKKRKIIIFNSISISILVEKKISGQKVPVPALIQNVDIKTASEISREIEWAKSRDISAEEAVINRPSSLAEKIYYHLPGFLRRIFWRILLSLPELAYKKMGNAVVTSIGMMGKINGWFIHRSVHPVSFGIGSVLKKPVVIKEEIKIREILNMTILVDHDVIDGAPMVRLLNDLTKSLEKGDYITTNKFE